jgi:PBP1b-binding outer membrane lipoprotein LpoB
MKIVAMLFVLMMIGCAKLPAPVEEESDAAQDVSVPQTADQGGTSDQGQTADQGDQG